MNEIHGNAISKKQPVFFSPRFKGVQEILNNVSIDVWLVIIIIWDNQNPTTERFGKKFDKDNHTFSTTMCF